MTLPPRGAGWALIILQGVASRRPEPWPPGTTGEQVARAARAARRARGSLSRALYGRQRVPRSHRRVLLALLAVPGGLPRYPLQKLAQARPRAVSRVLAMLEARGGTSARWLPAPEGERPRRAHALTPLARLCVLMLLGLEEDDGQDHAEATGDVPDLRAELYGGRRIPRSHRRVMLVLLTGAAGLAGGGPLMRLAQAGPGTAREVARALEARALAEGYPWPGAPGLPRKAWRLTPAGRAAVTATLLGLGPAGQQEGGQS